MCRIRSQSEPSRELSGCVSSVHIDLHTFVHMACTHRPSSCPWVHLPRSRCPYRCPWRGPLPGDRGDRAGRTPPREPSPPSPPSCRRSPGKEPWEEGGPYGQKGLISVQHVPSFYNSKRRKWHSWPRWKKDIDRLWPSFVENMLACLSTKKNYKCNALAHQRPCSQVHAKRRAQRTLPIGETAPGGEEGTGRIWLLEYTPTSNDNKIQLDWYLKIFLGMIIWGSNMTNFDKCDVKKGNDKYEFKNTNNSIT